MLLRRYVTVVSHGLSFLDLLSNGSRLPRFLKGRMNSSVISCASLLRLTVLFEMTRTKLAKTVSV